MFVVFFAAEATMLVASLTVLVLFAFTGPGPVPERQLPPGALVSLLIVPPVLAALVAIAGTALLGDGPSGRVRRELAFRWNWRDFGIGLAFGVGGLALTVPAAALWASWVGTDEANSAVGEAFAGRALNPAAALAVFVAVWLIAPLCEEVMFRGALWRALEHWRWNRWLILVVTSVVFSVAHLELTRTPLLLVLSIPIGLARLLTGNLLASIVAHQVNNFLPAVALLLATTGAVPLP